MKKVMLLFVLLIFSTNFLLAEKFRIGICGASEFSEMPHGIDDFKESDEALDIMPGLYWEVIFGNLGLGMTYNIKFFRIDSSEDGNANDWYFDWIGSIDLRYHFLRTFILDPFIEVSLGNAGRVDIPDCNQFDSEQINPMYLSLFAQFGIGLAVRLEGFHIGGKLVYRTMNEPPPATQFDIYPLKNFQFSLLIGLSL